MADFLNHAMTAKKLERLRPWVQGSQPYENEIGRCGQRIGVHFFVRVEDGGRAN